MIYSKVLLVYQGKVNAFLLFFNDRPIVNVSFAVFFLEKLGNSTMELLNVHIRILISPLQHVPK